MNRPRILLSVSAMDEAFAALYSALQQRAEVEIADLEHYSLRGTDIFIGKKMPEGKLAEADKLKAVFAYKTGVDDFPLRVFKERGILLINSHVNSRTIAQYAFGLAIALVSRIAEFDRKMRRGDWNNDNPFWKSLFNMKVGLAGYGHIGRELHRLLLANGIETYTIDRGKKYEGIKTVHSLEELCKETELLFLSMPRTKETDKLFDRELLWLLKNKYIVNVGRSNCIDEEALYEALTAGGMAGAAIDTWREKPKTATSPLIPFDYPFQMLDNILLSAHKAMQLCDGHARYVEDICEQVLRYIDGQPLENIVDCSRGY